MTGTDSAEQESRLLQAIAADPEDDRPRLEYARLLRKRGNPLGEFIHVDCAIARRATSPVSFDSLVVSGSIRLPMSGPWKVSPELDDWHNELWRLHKNEWSADLLRAGANNIKFKRGFPYELAIDADRFSAMSGRLLPLAPTVRAVTLERINLDEDYKEITPASPCPPEVSKAIADTPSLSRIWCLRLFGPDCWGDNAIKAILDSSYLGQLRHLDLSSSYPGPAIVEAALNPARFPNLQVLTLAANPLSTEHARRIASLPMVPPQLCVLDLSDSDINDEGAACLAHAPALSNLKELRVARSNIRERGIQALVDSPYLQNTLIYFKPPEGLADRHRIEQQLRRHNDRCLRQLSGR
jgi:uncharacterized protein (TIGR02996 family)